MENNIKSITNDRICDYLLCELNTDNRLRKLTKFLISLGTLNIRKSNGESLLSIPIGDRDPTVFDFILENGGDLKS